MQTLAQLIAEGTFPGRTKENASWIFDADEMVNHLYGHSSGWEDYDQASMFYKLEKMETVAINSWLCTDTYVGLYVLLLNDTPIAVTWQTGRKSERNVYFLSDEARELLRTRWEAYKIIPSTPATTLPDMLAAMPIANPGQPALEITDMGFPVLTLKGLLDWKDSLAPFGGIEGCSNIPLLQGAFKSANAAIASAQQRINRMMEYQSDFPDDQRAQDMAAEIIMNAQMDIAKCTTDIMNPLIKRLDAQ